MNQGRIWCVVHPTVGLPLFLGAVAVTSLVVHASIMTHTTWMGSYWMGSKARVAQEENAQTPKTAALPPGTAFSMTLTPVPATATSPASFVITVGPAAGGATATTVVSTKPETDNLKIETSPSATLHASNAN